MTLRNDRDWLPTWKSYAVIGPAVMRVKAAAIVEEIEARLALRDDAMVLMEGVAGKCEGAGVTVRAYGGAGEDTSPLECSRTLHTLQAGVDRRSASTAEGRSRPPPPPLVQDQQRDLFE